MNSIQGCKANISSFQFLLNIDVSEATVKEEHHWRNRPGYPDIAVLPMPQASHKFNQTLLLSEKSYKDLRRLKELLVQLMIVAEFLIILV